jgi:unspecific monooxygenase
MLMGLYSKTTLHASPEMRDICRVIVSQRLLPILEDAAQAQKPVDVLELSLSLSIDFINSYLFGVCNSSNFLQDVDARRKWMASHMAAKGYEFWRLEFPNLASFVEKLGVNFVPPVAVAAANEVNGLCLRLMKVDSSSPAKFSSPIRPGDRAVVYDKHSRDLRTLLDKESSTALSASQVRLTIASELMDHIKAGTETSGWTLMYLLHEMSQRPTLQRSLRKEILLSLEPASIPYFPVESTPTGAVDNNPTPRAIDALSLLHAVVLETLRFHPVVPGPHPRVTPKASFSATRAYRPEFASASKRTVCIETRPYFLTPKPGSQNDGMTPMHNKKKK